jgi:hypothetical protein
MVQFVFQCCPKTSIVRTFQVGGNFYCHGLKQHGEQIVFLHCIFHEIYVEKQIEKSF